MCMSTQLRTCSGWSSVRARSECAVRSCSSEVLVQIAVVIVICSQHCSSSDTRLHRGGAEGARALLVDLVIPFIHSLLLYAHGSNFSQGALRTSFTRGGIYSRSHPCSMPRRPRVVWVVGRWLRVLSNHGDRRRHHNVVTPPGTRRFSACRGVGITSWCCGSTFIWRSEIRGAERLQQSGQNDQMRKRSLRSQTPESTDSAYYL